MAIFTSFLYGSGIPILYPIALLNLISYYIGDKIMLTYYFKKPPLLDEKLSTKFNNILPYAVIFHLLFGFWMYSNPRLSNNLEKIETIQDEIKATFSSSTHFVHFLILGAIFFVAWFFK